MYARVGECLFHERREKGSLWGARVSNTHSVKSMGDAFECSLRDPPVAVAEMRRRGLGLLQANPPVFATVTAYPHAQAEAESILQGY